MLVDEYQDTNYAQQQLLRLLVADHRNVVVVGDDDQSIYRFRGASRKNIVDFQQTFPDAKVIRLETNYRSHQAILDAAHAVVEPNEHRLPKKLRSGAQPAARSASTPCRSGAARTSARRRRRWPPSSSGWSRTASTRPRRRCSCARCATRDS